MALRNRLLVILLCTCFLVFLNGFKIKSKDKGSESDLRKVLNNLLKKKSSQTETTRQNGQIYRSHVYLNGIVYTVDTKNTPNWHEKPKEAIVIENDKIAFVGSNMDAVCYMQEFSIVYDLKHAVVLPGFHDIHMHPLEAMSPVGGDCLLPNMKRPDDNSVKEVLSTCTKTASDVTEWVLGGGHSITPMMEYAREGKSPKQLLDEFISDRPAAMLEETSHSAWVNSMALERANITKNTAERPGGVIMRETNSKEPNGILLENEAINIFELAMNPTGNSEIQTLNYLGSLDALEELSKFGITSFCDARLFWKIKHHLVWEKVCDRNLLTARAILGLWAYPNLEDEYQIKELKQLYSDENQNCNLRKSQIKFYMDGIVQSTTAAMDSAYLVNLSLPIISKDNVGMNYFDKTRLEKYLKELQDFGDGHGFDFHIHAIGDRGIREALDAIEATKGYSTSRTPRHRLTHLEVIDPKDIERFKELGIIADFQVAGDFTLPAEYGELAKFIGVTKAEFSIPVKSVVDTGAVTTFSSDWDVSDLNPLKGIQHATERGSQSVSVKTAIEMYTVKPAFAMRQEDVVGVLKEGMDADFIIIDKDILHIQPDKIDTAKVIETVFRGERIYPWEGVIEEVSESMWRHYYDKSWSNHCY